MAAHTPPRAEGAEHTHETNATCRCCGGEGWVVNKGRVEVCRCCPPEARLRYIQQYAYSIGFPSDQWDGAAATWQRLCNPAQWRPSTPVARLLADFGGAQSRLGAEVPLLHFYSEGAICYVPAGPTPLAAYLIKHIVFGPTITLKPHTLPPDIVDDGSGGRPATPVADPALCLAWRILQYGLRADMLIINAGTWDAYSDNFGETSLLEPSLHILYGVSLPGSAYAADRISQKISARLAAGYPTIISVARTFGTSQPYSHLPKDGSLAARELAWRQFQEHVPSISTVVQYQAGSRFLTRQRLAEQHSELPLVPAILTVDDYGGKEEETEPIQSESQEFVPQPKPPTP